jgi:hypothetical protein
MGGRGRDGGRRKDRRRHGAETAIRDFVYVVTEQMRAHERARADHNESTARGSRVDRTMEAARRMEKDAGRTREEGAIALEKWITSVGADGAMGAICT